MKKYCAINIGSNSSKMLVAECQDNVMISEVKISKMANDIFVTGLGEEVNTTGRLTERGIKATVGAVKIFVETALKLGVEDIWITITAAGRKAVNTDELAGCILKETGINIEILPYTEEARLAVTGVLGSNVLCGTNIADVLVIDTGGASTEFIRMKDEISAATIDVGALTLTNEYLVSDPPEAEEIARMNEDIDKHLLKVKSGDPITKVIAVGGAIASLAMVRLGAKGLYEDIHGICLPIAYVESILEDFSKKSYHELKKIPGMPEGRHTTIFAGISILHRCMKAFCVDEIVISYAGILEGMIMDMAQIKMS